MIENNRFLEKKFIPGIRGTLKFICGEEFFLGGDWVPKDERFGITDIFDSNKDQLYMAYRNNIDTIDSTGDLFMAHIILVDGEYKMRFEVRDIDFRDPPKSGERYSQIAIVISTDGTPV